MLIVVGKISTNNLTLNKANLLYYVELLLTLCWNYGILFGYRRIRYNGDLPLISGLKLG
jgi:hypothetical protein